MRTSYDVIVVGAGPAGCVAARRAAENGLKTLLIEKRQEIGSPVRCAEAVGIEATRPFLAPDPSWIDATITSFKVINSQGVGVEVPPTETTLVVNRKVFDFQLALQAARCGAEVRTKTSAVGLDVDGSRVRGVKLEAMGRSETISAALVVAADGTESQVARWGGMNTATPPADFYLGAEFLLAGLKDRIDPQTCEYHLDKSLAPGGYLWVFPKGPDLANVGLVLPSNRHRQSQSAFDYLEQFVERHFPQTSVMAVIAGGIPAGGALKILTGDGLLVVGDAAHQADPLTAGGINLGMFAADMAMQVAVPAVKAGDTSRNRLQEYEALWHKRFGKEHAALYKLRKILARMSQERIDGLISRASSLPIDQMNLSQILLALLKNDPLLLFEARELIATGLIGK